MAKYTKGSTILGSLITYWWLPKSDLIVLKEPRYGLMSWSEYAGMAF